MFRLLSLFTDLQSFVFNLFAAVLLYLTPIKNYIHLVLILIFIDLITGSYAAIKEGEKFSARRLGKTVEKFIFYGIAIIVGYILQQIIDDGTQLSKLVSLYIGITEAKSIYENISRITKADIVSILWDAFKGKFDDMISNMRSKKTGQ